MKPPNITPHPTTNQLQNPPQQLTPATIGIASTGSVATTPIMSQLPQGPRPAVPSQIRPAEYLVLLAPNPGQPGVQGIRYPIQALNQPNFLQANPALLRSINSSQAIRAQAGPGVMRGQTTLMPTSALQGRHQVMASRATILQQPMLRAMGLGVQTSMGPAQIIQQQHPSTTTATAPSQMTPEDALKKGTSFFHSLLTRMNIKAKKIIMQNLIQSLIDGKRTSEEFALALQKELNSGPQVQLVPFLDLLLPNLRQAMISGQTTLPGIRPPGMPEVVPMQQQPQLTLPQQPQPQLQLQPHLQLQSQSQPSSQSQPLSQPQQLSQSHQPEDSTSSPSKAPKKKKVPLPPGQKSAWAIKKEAREAKKKAQGLKVEAEKPEKPVKPKVEKKKQDKQLELSNALRDDDDVNDVAAMGGVNLAEESQKIMASGAELVGTQIRSCKDEPFLDTNALAARIAKITDEYNLAKPSNDVITLISHATQERLKNLVERLGILAGHRSENLKYNPKYEPSTDIKGQIKFLAELDRIEKRRYEEQERELLLRVAKSRSKAEDPEQQKLRQKAKDMQRAEQEEVRQREANETALLAIGPRKKLKTASASSVNSFSQPSSLKDNKTPIDMRGDTIRRVKRVNMRDLQVLLELDRSNLNRLVKITAQ